VPCGCRSAQEEYTRVQREVDRGQFDAALSETDAALLKHQNKNDFWTWKYRILKARILVSRTQYEEALRVLDYPLSSSLAQTEIGEQRKVYQGMAHRSGQQFLEAEKDFEEAERIAQSLPAGFRCQIFIAKADLQVDEKRYADAEASYKQALALARQEKLALLEANALANLGRLATSQERFDQAIDINESALQLSKNLGTQGSAAIILGNIAWSYLELGDFDSALDRFKESAKAAEESGLPVQSAYWFTGVANTYIALRDYKSAEALSISTLKNARTLNNAQTITECLNTLAEIALRTNRLDEAQKYNDEALEWEQKGLDHFGTLESLLLSGRIETDRRHFEIAERLFQQVLESPNADTPLKWQAQAYLAEMHDQQGKSDAAEKEYQKAIGTIEAARSAVNRDDLRLSFLSGGIEFYDGYIDFLIRRGRSSDALKVADLSRARTQAERLSSDGSIFSVQASNIKPQQLAQRLNSTLLFYWLGYKNSYLWVITPSKITTISIPAESEIDSLVKPYREAAAKSKDIFATDSTTGQKLYEMLVQPAKKLIPIDSRVILFPDGKLYGLNFETLIVSDPQPHFWIEDVTLTTASSLSLLADSVAKRTSNDKRLLLVGDTVAEGTSFPSLPQAADEIQKVAHYFSASDRTILRGAEATPTAYLRSNPGEFSYLHFVTHGTASRTRPLESAVVLSKEVGGDSYKLYARDIVTHRLKADLVTISACNGSGTRSYSGEGMVGLSWAFLRAGAHNVIGALWEVSDVSTPLLMNDLYAGLAAGKDPAAALRDAKLALLHSRDVYRKPFYWAPFQLYSGS